jgi:hypothetical protein
VGGCCQCSQCNNYLFIVHNTYTLLHRPEFFCAVWM